MPEPNTIGVPEQPPVREKVEPISPALTEVTTHDDDGFEEPASQSAPQESCEPSEIAGGADVQTQDDSAEDVQKPAVVNSPTLEPVRAVPSDAPVVEALVDALNDAPVDAPVELPVETPAEQAVEQPTTVEVEPTVAVEPTISDQGDLAAEAVVGTEVVEPAAEVSTIENPECEDVPQAPGSVPPTSCISTSTKPRVLLGSSATSDATPEEVMVESTTNTPEAASVSAIEEKSELAVQEAEPGRELKSSRVEGAVSDGEPESTEGGADEDAHLGQPTVLQHSVSAVTKVKASSKPRRRKRKPTEFVKSPVPSQADASSFREAETHEGPSVFEVQPRAVKAADVSYKAPPDDSAKATTPSMFEKPAAPSLADSSFLSEQSSSQKKAVFSSHASPSMADVNYASPTPNKCTTSLFVSPPKVSTADTGANAVGLSSGFGSQKSVYESEARPSMAAVRACDPVPQSSAGPALFTKPPAETKAHARAGVELSKDPSRTASVFESAPKAVPVAAKWCDPVIPKNSGSVFESKAAPSRADAAADRSLDSDDEYETDTEED